jgi:nitroreductase
MDQRDLLSAATTRAKEFPMDVYEALYTTRAMRRVRPDPVPLDTQARILDAAIRAPTGGNVQQWRFVLVDDAETIGELGSLYRDSMDQVWNRFYRARDEALAATPDTPEAIQAAKVSASARWLAEHFETVPLYLLAFHRSDPTGGSIYPAVWSAMLAARAEGVGSCLTYALSLFHADDVFALLGVPTDKGWSMSACVSFGYPTGRWDVAPRRPAREVTFRNRWGTPAGFAADAPLWAPS